MAEVTTKIGKQPLIVPEIHSTEYERVLLEICSFPVKKKKKLMGIWGNLKLSRTVMISGDT